MTAAAQVLGQLLPVYPGQHRGVGDLVAVEVQDGKHGPIDGRVQELVRMPGRGQRAGLGLSVADHAGHQQIGVVEGSPVGVREAVAQLPTLVDGAGGLCRHVAGDASRERELLEETLHAGLVSGTTSG